ncbi:MAG TPA: hypothetical protein VL899_16795, partial [Alphaproteobacteria bacterium]|nr:hypothetical protein [Alphaproteobacteria bacterium]
MRSKVSPLSRQLLQLQRRSWGRISSLAPRGGAAGSGTLPDYPDIRYFYDEDAGSFGLRADDGQVLFQGKMGGDGLIRTDQDDVVGRNTGGSVIVDIDKIGSVLAAQVDNS